jgi:hypothetical protein
MEETLTRMKGREDTVVFRSIEKSRFRIDVCGLIPRHRVDFASETSRMDLPTCTGRYRLYETLLTSAVCQRVLIVIEKFIFKFI